MNLNNYIQSIQQFSHALSRVIPVCLNLRDSNGGILGDNKKRDMDNGDQGLYKSLYEQVAAAQIPQATGGSDGEQVWGFPLRLNSNVLDCFVTAEPGTSPETLFINRSDGVSGSRAGRNGFDSNTVNFINEQLLLLATQHKQKKDLDDFTEELSLQYEQINFIYDIEESLGHLEDFEKSLNTILQKSMELINADFTLLHIPSKQVFVSCEAKGCQFPAEFSDQSIMKNIGEFIISRIENVEYLTYEDMIEFPDMMRCIIDYGDLLVIPINFNNKPEGMMLFVKEWNNKRFSIGDKRMISVVSELISIQLTNIELFQDVKDFLINIIKSFVKTIEEKDAYTRGHSERVTKFSLQIGEKLGLSTEQLTDLKYSAILHDVGKIGIPGKILNKSASLDVKEYQLIKSHPIRGQGILEPIKQLKESIPGIVYHHERIDGKGYPEGLQGEKIPLFARIIAVADTYDAITSLRAYKKAQSFEAAAQILYVVRGTQLDAELVDIFLNECLRADLSEKKPETEAEVMM